MTWFMGLDDQNRPNGWDTEPWGNAIEVSQEVRDIHVAHANYVWNGTTLVEPVIPPPPVIDYTESNKAQLWEAAHQWEYQRISGAALSLLALGVGQGKPKCGAVAMWLKTLWDGNYYPRKALITSELIAPSHLDFSNVGEMPFTVQQMSDEVYG